MSLNTDHLLAALQAFADTGDRDRLALDILDITSNKRDSDARFRAAMDQLYAQRDENLRPTPDDGPFVTKIKSIMRGERS